MPELGDNVASVVTVSARGAGASRSAQRVRLVSVAAVVLTACGFDLLAEESPTHLAGVALVAAAVGGLRFLLRGHLAHVFTVVNLGVLVQPAAHALTEVAHAGAEQLPHTHVVPVDVWALLLQLAITLLVVLVAGSEPVLGFVVSRGLVALALLVGLAASPRTAPSARRVRVAAGHEPTEVLFARFRPRRGPPALAGALDH